MDFCQGQITQNLTLVELSTLIATYCLCNIDLPVKFLEPIPHGLGVMAYKQNLLPKSEPFYNRSIYVRTHVCMYEQHKHYMPLTPYEWQGHKNTIGTQTHNIQLHQENFYTLLRAHKKIEQNCLETAWRGRKLF